MRAAAFLYLALAVLPAIPAAQTTSFRTLPRRAAGLTALAATAGPLRLLGTCKDFFSIYFFSPLLLLLHPSCTGGSTSTASATRCLTGTDFDSDGRCDANDNCMRVFNPYQEDK
jgi:hypothetical protein